MKLFFLLALFLLQVSGIFAQKAKADSLKNLLSKQKTDTGKVKLMWQMADAINIYKPDTGLIIAQEALYLSQNVQYIEGESRSLGILANSFLKMGNYPKALEYFFRKLKIEETRKNYRALSSVIMNIGITYSLQNDFYEAIKYLDKADSLIAKYAVTDFNGSIAINKGDLYYKTGKIEQAKLFFTKALEAGLVKSNFTITGAAKMGLAHCLLKEKLYETARWNYFESIIDLQKVNNEELICESYLGLADLFEKTAKGDSAVLYARKSYALAKKDDFLSKEYDAISFLSKYYKSKNIDSAYAYLNLSLEIKEQLSGADKIRESQIISSNESLRQAEIALEKKKAKSLRRQQLQLLFIGIFIPSIFLITFIISRKKVSPKLIKLMGIISLLIFFEYLTLLLHPFVADLTGHTPIYEILIFVCLAAFLIPAHHRLEHWFINRITQRNMVITAPENKETTMVNKFVTHFKNKRRHKKPPHK